MNDIQSQTFIFSAFLSALLLWSIYKWLYNPNEFKNSPPSPPMLPILGNLHQIGSPPHRSLQSLALKYGPLMLLHFGRVPVLVVSSADAASEILKTHDATFANRPQFKAFMKLSYDAKDIVFAPYGDYWKKLRRTFSFQLVSSKRVQSFRPIREDETALLMKKISESEGPINLSKLFGEFTNDLICRSAFGCKFRELGNEKLVQLIVESMELLGSISIGDFIPWLSWIDRVRGFDKRLDNAAKEMDDFLEGVIQQRVQQGKGKAVVGGEGNNFIDILLDVHSKNTTTGDSIGRVGIKTLVIDAIVGGTDTIATALEWVMTELLRHPDVMEKLQNEVRVIAGEKAGISSEDLEEMHYMKAVIKESLRYHPPAAQLAPRVASKDVNVQGYDISKGTVVMVNVWAIGRDPASWDEPEKFKPERFLNSRCSMELKGSDFELIPFGAGRRGCPGMTYSMPAIELVLANIVHKFNWNMPDGVVLDMTECAGLATHRAVPLVAVASKPA